jgi:hypothetical protein
MAHEYISLAQETATDASASDVAGPVRARER